MEQPVINEWDIAFEQMDKMSKIEEQKAKVSPDIKQPLASLMETLKVASEEKEKKLIEERGYSIDFVKELLKKSDKEIAYSKCLRDFNFIKILFEEELLAIDGLTLNPKNTQHILLFNLFRSFIRCTYEIFEEDWDFGFNKISSKNGINIREIVVRFPEFYIKNTSERRDGHKIKDLFISIPLSASLEGYHGARLYTTTLKGFRTTVSYFEMEAAYAHSHLHRANHDTTYVKQLGKRTYTNDYSDYFCLGSGGIHKIFDKFMDIIISEDNKEKIIPRYETLCFEFLLHLFTIATHESLEGTPYVNYSNIKKGFTSSGSSNIHRMYHFNHGRLLSLCHLFTLTISNINRHPEELRKIDLKINYSTSEGKYVVPMSAHNISEMRKIQLGDLENVWSIIRSNPYMNDFAKRTGTYTDFSLNVGYSGQFNLFYTYKDDSGTEYFLPNPSQSSSGDNSYPNAVRNHKNWVEQYKNSISSNAGVYIFNGKEFPYTIEPPINPNPESTGDANKVFQLNEEIIANYFKYLENDINKREIRNKAYSNSKN